MNENVYIYKAHKNIHTKPVVFTAPDAPCIHVAGSHKPKPPKIVMPIKYKHPLPHPSKVQLYIVVNCRNIHRVKISISLHTYIGPSAHHTQLHRLFCLGKEVS